MKIPREIQNKMHKLAKLHNQAYALMKEIDAFFEEEGLDIDMLRCGNGISLEEIDGGNDVTKEFVAWAKRDFE